MIDFDGMGLCRLWQDAESRVYLVNELDKRTGQVKFHSIILLFLVLMEEEKGKMLVLNFFWC